MKGQKPPSSCRSRITIPSRVYQHFKYGSDLVDDELFDGENIRLLKESFKSPKTTTYIDEEDLDCFDEDVEVQDEVDIDDFIDDEDDFDEDVQEEEEVEEESDEDEEMESESVNEWDGEEEEVVVVEEEEEEEEDDDDDEEEEEEEDIMTSNKRINSKWQQWKEKQMLEPTSKRANENYISEEEDDTITIHRKRSKMFVIESDDDM